MTSSIKFSLTIFTLFTLLFIFSCSKDNNEELLIPQNQSTIGLVDTDQDNNSFRAKPCKKDCCWERCPGTRVGCDCSTFNNSEYEVKITGITSEIAVILAPKYTQFDLKCDATTFTQDGTYIVTMDTERYNIATEGVVKDGVQWKARMQSIGVPPFQIEPVKVEIRGLEWTCTNNDDFIFDLDFDTETTIGATKEYCLQCGYSAEDPSGN